MRRISDNAAQAVQAHRSKTRLPSQHSDPELAYFQEVPEDEEFAVVQTDHCGSWFVVHNDNPLRRAWSVTVYILLGYTATAFLYRLCFCIFHISEDGLSPIGLDDPCWNAIDTIVDVLFWCDLVLNFFLSYQNPGGHEVDSLRLIARNYLLGYFWINLLACLPESAGVAIVRLFTNEGSSQPGVNKIMRVTRLQRMSRLARLVRLTRLAKLASCINNSPHWRWVQSLRGVRIINFITGLLWAVHLLACFWYLSAALHTNPRHTWVGRRSVDTDGTSLLQQPPEEQWLVAMYFVLTVFTTVGFGDISANTEAEIVCAALTMVVGAVVHSIIVSEVIQIITSTDQVEELLQKQLKALDGYAQHTALDAAVQRRMREEIGWRAKSLLIHQNFDRAEMMRLITGRFWTRPLMDRIPGGLFGGQLVRNGFLTCQGRASMPPRLALLLAVHLTWAEFAAGEIVYQAHDFALNLFLVLGGTFACVGRPTPKGGFDDVHHFENTTMEASPSATAASAPPAKGIRAMLPHIADIVPADKASPRHTGQLYPYRLFGSCGFFGDVEMVRGCRYLATMRCEVPGQTLVLDRKNFAELQEQFPQCRGKWQIAARHREGCRKHALRQLTHGLTFRHFAAARIQAFWQARRRRRALAAEGNGHREEQFGAFQFRFGPRKSAESACAQSGEGGVHELARELQLSLSSLQADFEQSVSSLRTDFGTFRSEVRDLLRKAKRASAPASSAHGWPPLGRGGLGRSSKQRLKPSSLRTA